MENQQKNPRTDTTKDRGYEIEKNRMDYEGGNQGRDKTTQKKQEKSEETKVKNPDSNPNSSQEQAGSDN